MNMCKSGGGNIYCVLPTQYTENDGMDFTVFFNPIKKPLVFMIFKKPLDYWIFEPSVCRGAFRLLLDGGRVLGDVPALPRGSPTTLHVEAGTHDQEFRLDCPSFYKLLN